MRGRSRASARRVLADCRDTGVVAELLMSETERALQMTPRTADTDAAGGRRAERTRVDGPAPAGGRPVPARDRRGALHLAQHRQGPHAQHLPQARRLELAPTLSRAGASSPCSEAGATGPPGVDHAPRVVTDHPARGEPAGMQERSTTADPLPRRRPRARRPGARRHVRAPRARLERPGESSLTGTFADQAQLYGLLERLQDLGIPIVSVNPVA